MGQLKTKEELVRYDWCFDHADEMIFNATKRLKLEEILTQDGIDMAIKKVTPTFKYRARYYSETKKELAGWLEKEFYSFVHYTGNSRVYRLDIIEYGLRKLRLFDKIIATELRSVILLINRDVRDDFIKRHKKLKKVSLDHDEYWLKKQVEGLFQTPKYQKFLIASK